MSSKLTENEKQALRSLAEIVKRGDFPEEFEFDGDGLTPTISSIDHEKSIDVPWLTALVLDALVEATYVRRINQKGSGPICKLTQYGKESVETNFAPAEGINVRQCPVEISESLRHFREDYPDQSKVAFLMMQFRESPAHLNIRQAVQEALGTFGMVALRADAKQYHDNLFYNILTYIYGCRFGIAVFERIEDETINPNVSLEVGYLMGLGKHVCYLKDKTQRQLQTDLIGTLYKDFDPQDCGSTIPRVLRDWMDDKGIISRPAGAA